MAGSRRRSRQLALDLPEAPRWGGPRAGAGRKPSGVEAGVSHRRELRVTRHTPIHVTLRARSHVWNLRSRRGHRAVEEALRGVHGRPGFRVVHFSVQGNHVHLVVEADDRRALACGMKALTRRLAAALNALMRRAGPVFRDRYHAHVLRTPRETANALAYVLANFASHAARRGERVARTYLDEYSSAAPAGPDGSPPPVSAPRSWLLRLAGERLATEVHGPDLPGARALRGGGDERP